MITRTTVRAAVQDSVVSIAGGRSIGRPINNPQWVNLLNNSDSISHYIFELLKLIHFADLCLFSVHRGDAQVHQ